MSNKKYAEQNRKITENLGTKIQLV